MDTQIPMGITPIVGQNGPGPLGVWLHVTFRRLPKRAKCGECGNRRVLFAVGVGDEVLGSARCAQCAGIR